MKDMNNLYLLVYFYPWEEEIPIGIFNSMEEARNFAPYHLEQKGMYAKIEWIEPYESDYVGKHKITYMIKAIPYYDS